MNFIYTILVVILVIWAISISCINVSIRLYKKSQGFYQQAGDFYERSTELSEIGEIEDAEEILKVGHEYKEEGDYLMRRAYKWPLEPLKEIFSPYLKQGL